MRLLSLSVVGVLMAGAVSADDIRRACLKSERGMGQHVLCRCIQDAADKTLSNREQSTAARFFRDPDAAQRVRRSDRRGDEKFWERYERFGQVAARACRR
ncbi:MAG: hypothetical protein HKN18_10910 [Silicimonas sp.]|nr:hypothetical protein [Silicimonas sp.]